MSVESGGDDLIEMSQCSLDSLKISESPHIEIKPQSIKH